MNPFVHQGQQVRTIIIDNQPWFVAKDVSRAIGLTDVFQAINRLDDDEKGTNSIRTLGGLQPHIIINESGLYHLLLTSRRPEAKPFRKWVTSEVLPALRRTGAYAVADAVPQPRGTQGSLFPGLPSTDDLRIQSLLVDVALQCRPGSKVAQLVRLVKTRLNTPKTH